MTTANQSFAVLSHPSLDHSGGGRLQADANKPAGLVESAELLKGAKAVGILHNGSLYRLQSTKLGKLILTK